MDKKEEYFTFLDELRDSRIVNMFGATPFLQQKYRELSRDDAIKIIAYWMKSYAKRHPQD